MMEEDPVICTPRSGVDVPGGDVTNSIGGESIWAPPVSLLLGIADIEDVPLWRLSIATSERLNFRGD